MIEVEYEEKSSFLHSDAIYVSVGGDQQINIKKIVLLKNIVLLLAFREKLYPYTSI